ncbi:hypothetical protein [Acinetobacter variabilis]|uniref:hypothetical protein n=1 Tax=Acinetobacter variabilis TaxID=70346 RepID=UPI00403E0273
MKTVIIAVTIFGLFSSTTVIADVGLKDLITTYKLNNKKKDANAYFSVEGKLYSELDKLKKERLNLYRKLQDEVRNYGQLGVSEDLVDRYQDVSCSALAYSYAHYYLTENNTFSYDYARNIEEVRTSLKYVKSSVCASRNPVNFMSYKIQ